MCSSEFSVFVSWSGRIALASQILQFGICCSLKLLLPSHLSSIESMLWEVEYTLSSGTLGALSKVADKAHVCCVQGTVWDSAFWAIPKSFAKLWRPWGFGEHEKGRRSLCQIKKERPCEKRIRICRCLCQFYGSSGWKLCQVVNMKTLKTSILGRRGSCWRSDEWRSGLFPWQPPRWRHGWGQDGLQMGCSSVCGSVWWRIVWWTGWNHVARDVWPQGRAAFIIFITSSSKEKSKEERPRKGNRLVQDVSFAKDKPLWMKFMVLLVLLYSRESCMMQSIVENAWTFTANQLRSLMKKQVREGEGSISLEWDYLDYLHNFLETHHMFAAKKWELIRLRISQRCLESEADRLHHRDYNSQTEQTWTNDKRRQNWSQHHTTHVTTIEDTCIARRHCQWHIIYARLQRLTCTFQVEVAGKSETWKAQNAHENSWKLLQVIRSLS